jgi:uncharacterized Zn-binding protein involved in type VI secretion
MPRKARLNDSISHGGSIVEASGNVTCNGRRVARRGDRVVCVIHGSQTIVGGSSTVSTNGRQTARLGDAISCGAVISSASPDVETGG